MPARRSRRRRDGRLRREELFVALDTEVPGNRRAAAKKFVHCRINPGTSLLPFGRNRTESIERELGARRDGLGDLGHERRRLLPDFIDARERALNAEAAGLIDRAPRCAQQSGWRKLVDVEATDLRKVVLRDAADDDEEGRCHHQIAGRIGPDVGAHAEQRYFRRIAPLDGLKRRVQAGPGTQPAGAARLAFQLRVVLSATQLVVHNAEFVADAANELPLARLRAASVPGAVAVVPG